MLLAALVVPLRIDAQCNYSVSPSSIQVDAAGTPVASPRSFTVTTGSGCSSAVTVDADWVQVVGSATGTGSRTITVSVRANPGIVPRSTTVRVGTAAVTVSQTANCSFSLNPLSASIPASGATGRTFQVTAPSYCQRTVFASDPWVTITSGTGSGSGSVIYSVEPNLSPQPREATITIVNRTFRISQEGGSCTYALALEGAPATVPAGGGRYPLTVATSCRWTLTANVPWIELGQPVSGQGPGRTTVVVLPNEGVGERSGQVLAPAGALAILQGGRGCTITADPPSVITGSSARSGSISLQAACAWTAASDAPWLRITSGAQGSAGGVIQWAAEENASTLARTGTITVRTATAAAVRITIQQASRAPFITVDSIVNAASFRGGSISPGEILSAFGLNIGPRDPVGVQTSADGRFVTTEVARVRVLVDGIPSPITYADSGQVNFVAPYGIAGREQSEVRTEYNGLLSEPIRIPVATANPEIFPSGTSGQGAILNADSRPNSVTNPARRGSVIQIFATGLGATTPPGIDGYVPTTVPLPEPSGRVRVFVAGQECRVLYAGAAPFLVSGVMQVNCELPLTVTGVSDVSLFVGDRRNRSRTTVAVE